ncbi:MAG: peroxiredoxin [Verrucomicrobia bacterium]|nr:peroxiredoxin [Verrucomicrobiota bacterium]
MFNLPRSLALLAVGLAAFFTLASARALEVGDPAPQVTAQNQDGKPLVFADIYRQGVTLVYFYPKAGTSGCTAEACSLRDNYDDLVAKGVRVIGVSEDSAEAQKKFQTENQLPFPLVADTDGAVAKAFGVPMNNGMTKRQSFLIKDGKIAWLDLSVSPAQHTASVRDALAKLGGS